VESQLRAHLESFLETARSFNMIYTKVWPALPLLLECLLSHFSFNLCQLIEESCYVIAECFIYMLSPDEL
jgi:hypothetical protein